MNMQTEKYIEFKREREMSEIITDTFNFIRHNYKSLSQVVYKIVGPVLLLAIVAFVGYLYLVQQDFERILESITSNNLNFSNTFIGGFLVFFLISLLFYGVFYATINFSIESYIENEGKIDSEEVSKNVRENWGKFFGLAFLAAMLVFLGFMFFFIPGIYFFVPMSLIFPIMTFEKFGINDTLSYSFSLIKRNWWSSFITLLLIGVIYYLGSSIFQIPAFIYSLIRTLVGTGEISNDAGFFEVFDIPYLILTVIGAIGRFVLYIIMIIAGTFIYFNLDEKQNRTGTYESIDNLGEQ